MVDCHGELEVAGSSWAYSSVVGWQRWRCFSSAAGTAGRVAPWYVRVGRRSVSAQLLLQRWQWQHVHCGHGLCPLWLPVRRGRHGLQRWRLRHPVQCRGGGCWHIGGVFSRIGEVVFTVVATCDSSIYDVNAGISLCDSFVRLVSRSGGEFGYSCCLGDLVIAWPSLLDVSSDIGASRAIHLMALISSF